MLSAVFVYLNEKFHLTFLGPPCLWKVVLVKPGSHILPNYLQGSLHLQLTKFDDLLQWVPNAPAIDCQHTQICTM